MNWKFTETTTRKFFAKHLDVVPVSSVKNEALVAIAAENEFKGTGFGAMKYIDHLKNSKLMVSYNVKHLAALLAQMAPVYALFGYELAEEVLDKIPAKRFLQLNYPCDERYFTEFSY